MIKEIQIMFKNGKQYIPDLQNVELKPPYRGRPEISDAPVDEHAIAELCPMEAISAEPLTIDIGKCNFCGECAFQFPQKIKFTTDYKIATNIRENLIIKENIDSFVKFDNNKIRKKIKGSFKKSLKLRQVSAGGDNSCELELGACGNANFDMGRIGIEFVASPLHADGIVVTGPISENMSEALKIAYDLVPEPKLFILCGVDAICGGIFAESNALDRSILDKVNVDLYIPGNPPHPLTIINGLIELMK